MCDLKIKQPRLCAKQRQSVPQLVDPPPRVSARNSKGTAAVVPLPVDHTAKVAGPVQETKRQAS